MRRTTITATLALVLAFTLAAGCSDKKQETKSKAAAAKPRAAAPTGPLSAQTTGWPAVGMMSAVRPASVSCPRTHRAQVSMSPARSGRVEMVGNCRKVSRS